IDGANRTSHVAVAAVEAAHRCDNVLQVRREDRWAPGDLCVAAVDDWRQMCDLLGRTTIDAGPDLRCMLIVILLPGEGVGRGRHLREGGGRDGMGCRTGLYARCLTAVDGDCGRGGAGREEQREDEGCGRMQPAHEMDAAHKDSLDKTNETGAVG